MRRHHRHHHRPRWGRQGWRLIRGMHRRLMAFLLVGFTLGALAGVAVHAGLAGEKGLLFLGIAAATAVWPLAWIATFRIARPIQELARVAGALREGRLTDREALPQAHEPGEELTEVASALRGMAERLERQLADQKALLAAVSHELRSPLGRARVLVELSRDGSGPADIHDRLQGEIDAMDTLVGDLLAAARIDFEAITPRDLDAVELARRALTEVGADPAALQGPESAAIRADPTLLLRALTMLLANARRHGGGVVRLGIVETAAGLRFEVDDDGPGFPPGQAEQAFQPFWRGPDGAPGGTGLGLALVRRIAEIHGGSAGAMNREGGGARAWLEIG